MDKKAKVVSKDKEQSDATGTAPDPVRIGQVLVRAGRITPEELETALNEQSQTSKRLGEVLIEKGSIKPDELTHGLNVQSMLVNAGLTSAGLSLGSLLGEGNPESPVAAKDSSDREAGFTRSHLGVKYQAPSIPLNGPDVRKGYVELPEATEIIIKSNNKAGCLVVFNGLEWPFKEVCISGLEKDLTVTQEGASLLQPHKDRAESYKLTYKFILSEDAKAGEYPWPLSIALQPV
jgi:hypothetical protein